MTTIDRAASLNRIRSRLAARRTELTRLLQLAHDHHNAHPATESYAHLLPELVVDPDDAAAGGLDDLAVLDAIADQLAATGADPSRLLDVLHPTSTGEEPVVHHD